MFSLLMLAAVIPESSDSPVGPPAWTPASMQPAQYRRFTRGVEHGPNEGLSERTNVCNCEPAGLANDLTARLRLIPGTSFVRNSVSTCGKTAEHLVVTGPVGGRSRKNFDLYAYRSADALVVITDAFTKAAAAAANEDAMRTMCATDADRANANRRS